MKNTTSKSLQPSPPNVVRLGTATTPTPLLSPAEAAAILGVKAETLSVWRCTKRYPLPFVRVGRSIKYRREDLEAFISGRTVGAEG